MGSKPSQFRMIEEVEAKDDDVDAHPKFESHPPLPVPALDVSANNSRQGTPRPRRSIEDAPINPDVLISYSDADKEIMQTIKETLIKNGLKVWVDVVGLAAGVNFLSKIGEAIIDSKTFITLLSENSIKSKYCQDELALAYIANKPIFPISTRPSKELVPLMDTGMRMMLAGMKWTVIDETTDVQKKTTELLTLLKDQMSELEAKSRTGAKSNERAGAKIVEKNTQPESKPTSDNSSLCAICLDEPADVVVLPCGHICMCVGCADQIRQMSNECPLCRRRIANAGKTFRS